MKLHNVFFLLTLCGSTFSSNIFTTNENQVLNLEAVEVSAGVKQMPYPSNVDEANNDEELDPRFNFRTHVTLYENGNYGGGSVNNQNLEDYSYIYFTSFSDKTSSFKITQGSCFKMYDYNPPGGETYYADKDYTGLSFNDRISSISSCGSVQRSFSCPAGSFVKRIRWDSAGGLVNGIDMYCYKPENKTVHTAILSTHSKSYTGGDKMCTGIRGILNYRDGRRQTYYNMDPICSPDEPTPDKFMCKAKEAISGISVRVESNTNHIKTMSYSCRNVGDIEKICQAEDEIQALFTCDATGAVAPLKCTWQKKVGYGAKSSMSESESISKTFYSEYGFEMGAAGYGLSANFKATLGESLTTGYNWIQTQESTWSTEVTFTIEIEAPPTCKTVVSEIFGECSFMAVRPYHFTRNDTCLNATDGSYESFITQETIPENIKEGEIFKSKIPNIVLNYF